MHGIRPNRIQGVAIGTTPTLTLSKDWIKYAEFAGARWKRWKKCRAKPRSDKEAERRYQPSEGSSRLGSREDASSPATISFSSSPISSDRENPSPMNTATS